MAQDFCMVLYISLMHHSPPFRRNNIYSRKCQLCAWIPRAVTTDILFRLYWLYLPHFCQMLTPYWRELKLQCIINNELKYRLRLRLISNMSHFFRILKVFQSKTNSTWLFLSVAYKNTYICYLRFKKNLFPINSAYCVMIGSKNSASSMIGQISTDK